jgi:hypothetical protein
VFSADYYDAENYLSDNLILIIVILNNLEKNKKKG